MFNLVFDTFLILFVVIDPVGLTAIFAALTQSESEQFRRRMAFRGTLLAAIVLFVFTVFGDPLLSALGIGLPAFRIAGGALLFLLAVDMLFARHSGVRAPTPREQAEAEQRRDISVFPLAIPLIAGPGAITTVLLMAGSGRESPATVGIMLAMLGVVLGITLVLLLLATRVVRVLGETGANVVSRVLGIVLAALAVQYMLDGLNAGLVPALAPVPG